MKIPFRIMTTSALTTMTIVSGLGLNALSASANSTAIAGDKSDAALIAKQNEAVAHAKAIEATQKALIAKENPAQRTSYVNLVNHVVRDDNVNYIPNNTMFKNVTVDSFTQYKIEPDTVGHAMAGDKSYQAVLANDFLNLSSDSGKVAVEQYNYLRSNYLRSHKYEPYVTATRAGNVYKDAKLTKKAGKSFKEDDLFRIQAIYSVNGKQRFKLADGNYISGYHAVINRDFTSNADETRLFSRIVYIGKKPARELSRTYYVRTPHGHKHFAVIRKSVIKHARVNFADMSSVSKKNKVRKGSVVRFVKVVRNGNTFRLKLTSGQYITANKAFVHVIR